MEYIGNRPQPGGTRPDRWWLEDWTGGSGRDYQDQSFEEAYREFLRQQQQQPPQQSNEGQTTETPEGTAPGGTPQDPVFRTDVIGNAPTPVEYLPTNIGNLNPGLNEYLLSLPQPQGGTGSGGSGSGGGTTPTFSTDVTGFSDPSYPFPGPYKVEDYDPNPPPSTFKTDVDEFGDPTYPFPGKYPWEGFTPNPPPGGTTTKIPPVGPKIIPIIDKVKDKVKKVITGGGGGGGGTGGGGQQQQQKPGVGKLLAALPMLAAFQGGTTTTPAPYAHLGPHTPVAPVFKPQGRGNPIPSIGQLLAGVR